MYYLYVLLYANLKSTLLKLAIYQTTWKQKMAAPIFTEFMIDTNEKCNEPTWSGEGKVHSGIE